MYADISHIGQMNHCWWTTDGGPGPLLLSFCAKLYDHYRISDSSERAAMGDYFKFYDDISLLSKLLGGEKNDSICFAYDFIFAMADFNNDSIRNLTPFKNKLESFA